MKGLFLRICFFVVWLFGILLFLDMFLKMEKSVKVFVVVCMNVYVGRRMV